MGENPSKQSIHAIKFRDIFYKKATSRLIVKMTISSPTLSQDVSRICQ